MNPLNLRVSSTNFGENIRKNSEMRTSLISLSPKYFKDEDEKLFNEFSKAKTVPEQVLAVERIYNNYKQNVQSIQFLVHLYFYAPLKHPVKGKIARLLQNSRNSKTDISLCLDNGIKKLLKSENDNANFMHSNQQIISVNGCFENFACALKAIENNLQIILPFIHLSLEKYMLQLNIKSSSSIKNEIYIYIHNAIRLILSCSQEFPEIIAYKHNMEIFRKVNNIGKHIMRNNNIPMDTRRNCGILFSYFIRIENIQSTSTPLQTYYAIRSRADKIEYDNSAVELCLCAGIINTLTFSDFCIYSTEIKNILKKVMEITHKHSTEPSMLLLSTRSLLQISKHLLSFKLNENLLEDLKEISIILKDFCLVYLEIYLDSVRHMCKDLLRNTMKLEKKLQSNESLKNIFAICKYPSTSICIKCTILSVAGEIFGSKIVLEYNSNLFTELFHPYLAIDLNVSNCYESLMINSYKEMDFETWTSTWLAFLLEFSSEAAENNERLSIAEILINKAIKNNSNVLEVILDENCSPRRDKRKVHIRIRMSAMWTARKNGIQAGNFDEILNKCSDDLKLAILSHCDSTKIMALRLLVETHKTTETISQLECNLILLYIEYNSNTQSPATREKSLALILKFLNRFELNLVKIIKTGRSNGFYSTFLKKLFEILKGNLFTSANFSRRSISLHLLRSCIEIVVRNSLPLEDFIPDQDFVRTVFNCLNDSYEENKIVAISILKTIANKGHVYEELNFNIIHEMMISIKPTDSATAAYYLEYYCHIINENHVKNILNIKSVTLYNPVYYAIAKWCLGILQEGLKCAKLSILLAARKNPLYGTLLALRHLMGKLNYEKLADEDKWKDFIISIIVICKELTQIVGPVVNSSSPEGHLPNDFSEVPDYLLGSQEENNLNSNQCLKILSTKQFNNNKEILRTTPQMVLLCAWRTVKEVSLILGDIVLRSPIQSKEMSQAYLVTTEQILEIGLHFTQMLSETKHRGAFEQAYVGFSKLCARLWRVRIYELNELPMKWLKELIVIISNDEKLNEKICATRRSAGVPFMIQALITAELQVGTIKSLHFCMEHLIGIVLSRGRNSTTEARTHFLNILRALFRCSDLNEVVGEYISDGIKCALRSYEADNWSERNSATLLFSALITRIFGVQRTKDSENLNIRNKMTGRIFFLRYPDLYDFFLGELKQINETNGNNKKTDKLYALLLILSRLYPSALEGTESNLKLSRFVPFMSACSVSPEMRTRILTAKAIVPLISPDFVNKRIFEIVESIKDCKLQRYQDSNTLHGALIQILFLIKSKKSIVTETLLSISSELIAFDCYIFKNVTILTTFLEIIIECLKSFSYLSEALAGKLIAFAEKLESFSTNYKIILPQFQRLAFLYNLHILNLLKLPEEIFQLFLINLQMQPSRNNYEKNKTILNIVFILLFPNYSVFNDIEDFETHTIERDFVKNLNEEIRQILKVKIMKSIEFLKCLKEIAEGENLYFPELSTKSYALLSRLDEKLLIEAFHLIELIEKSTKSHRELKTSITLCIKRIINSEKVKEVDLMIYFDFLKNISQPWNCLTLRFAAIKLIEYMFESFLVALKVFNNEIIAKYSAITLRLLNDNDSSVRSKMSAVILSLLKNSTNNCDEIYPKGISSYADFIPVPSYAQKIFLHVIISEYFDAGKNMEEICSIINAIVENYENDIESTDIDDIEIFDKNEVNVFAESGSIVLDCSEFLKNTNEFKFIEKFNKHS